MHNGHWEHDRHGDTIEKADERDHEVLRVQPAKVDVEVRAFIQVHKLVNVLALRLPPVERTPSIHEMEEFHKVHILEKKPPVWHENLHKICLVYHVAYVGVPFF